MRVTHNPLNDVFHSANDGNGLDIRYEPHAVNVPPPLFFKIDQNGFIFFH